MSAADRTFPIHEQGLTAEQIATARALVEEYSDVVYIDEHDNLRFVYDDPERLSGDRRLRAQLHLLEHAPRTRQNIKAEIKIMRQREAHLAHLLARGHEFAARLGQLAKEVEG